jgi:hypothetical protein
LPCCRSNGIWAINRSRADVPVRDTFKHVSLAKIYRREYWEPSPADVAEIEREARAARQDFADDPA